MTVIWFACVFSIVLSYVLAERLLTGHLVSHVFLDKYWHYEIGFFVTLSLSYLAIRRRVSNLILLITVGGAVGYITT